MGDGATEPLRVLLVDDCSDYAALVEEMLDACVDLEFERAEMIADASERLREPGVDCVLLDLGLPDADGLEGIHELTVAAPEVPIVVLTGREDDELAVQIGRAHV